MDTLDTFFARLLPDHCACFSESCQISNIASPRVNDLLASYSQTFLHSIKPPQNCKIIHASSEPSTPTTGEPPLLPQDNIEIYLDCMVDLGLVLPPKKRFNPDSSFESNGTQLYSISIDELQEPTSKTATIMSKKPHYFYIFYNGKHIDWEFMKSEWKPHQLPTTFINKMSPLKFSKTELLDLAKMLFWFLRKGVVDNLITSVMPQEVGCLALSAGSINVTSDYDVNVYGAGSEWVSIFFQDRFLRIFGRTSDHVFDTNIYSSSFMNMLQPEQSDRYVKAGCGPYTFWYVDFDSRSGSGMFPVYDQHVWATLKVINALLSLLHSKDFRTRWEAQRLYYSLKNNPLFSKMERLSGKLTNMRQTADELVFALGLFDMDFRTFVNHLSLINYKGSETYYTRGAFLDVVVNQQMCKSGRSLNLDEHVYFDSMIENLADYCRHDRKAKYRNRVAIARGHLVNIPMLMPGPMATLDKFLVKESTASISNLLSAAWKMCEVMALHSPSSVVELDEYADSFDKRVTTSFAQLI